MGRKFVIEKDYRTLGYDLYKAGEIEINPGVTVLVGCNGIGKTTLIHAMISSLEKDNIPFIMFDNLNDGGKISRDNKFYDGDMESWATLSMSSEGENICENMADFAGKIGSWIKDGKTDENAFVKSFAKILWGEKEEDKAAAINERWIFLDAIDSGLSVDNIVDIKHLLFDLIINEQEGKNDIYIVVSANEYEMANREECFDVYNGKYIKFNNYDEYRDMILKSKEWKIARMKVKNNESKEKDVFSPKRRGGKRGKIL